MSYTQRFIYGTMTLIGGFLMLGFIFEGNGTANRHNPVWQLVGPIFYLILFCIKWSVILAALYWGGKLCIFCYGQWLEWREEVRTENVKREFEEKRLEDERQRRLRQEAAVIARLNLERHYRENPHLAPKPEPVQEPALPPPIAEVVPPKPRVMSTDEAIEKTLKDLFGRS